MKLIGHAIDLFIAELANRGCSDATMATYSRILIAFADHAGEDMLVDIRTEHVRGYLKGFADRKSKPATIAHQVSVLSSFFAWCLDEGAIDPNPMVRIKRPRVPPAEERDVVTVDALEVRSMLAACTSWPEIVCLNLILYTGIRRGAAARLRWRDVDTGRGVIRFVEKGPQGGKIIEKPIADELARVLAEGIRCGGLDPNPDAYVIPYRQPKKARTQERTGRLIYNIVTDVAKRAGVRSHVHSLRAAFAVQFLAANPGELLALQALLGHSRLETTQGYLRRADRAKAMEQVRSMSWGTHVDDPDALMSDLRSALDDAPGGLRSRVSALKGRRPSPLDDGGASTDEDTVRACTPDTAHQDARTSTGSSRRSPSDTLADVGDGSAAVTARDTRSSAQVGGIAACSRTDGRTSTSPLRSPTDTTSITPAPSAIASTPGTSKPSPAPSTIDELEIAARRPPFPSAPDPLDDSALRTSRPRNPHGTQPVLSPNPPVEPDPGNDTEGPRRAP